MGAQLTQQCGKTQLERVIQCNCADVCDADRQVAMEHAQGVHNALNTFLSELDSNAGLTEKHVNSLPKDSESHVFPLKSYEPGPKRDAPFAESNLSPTNFGEIRRRKPLVSVPVRTDRAIVSTPVPCRPSEEDETETGLLWPSVVEDAQGFRNLHEVESSPEISAAVSPPSDIDTSSAQLSTRKQFADKEEGSLVLTPMPKRLSEDEEMQERIATVEPSSDNAPPQAKIGMVDETLPTFAPEATTSEAFNSLQKTSEATAVPLVAAAPVDEEDWCTLTAEVDLLQGAWKLANTEAAMAMLTDSQVHWWPRNRTPPNDFQITEHGTISLLMDGVVCEGTLSSSTPSRYRLNWSDGEVWEKLRNDADDLSGVWRTDGDRLPIAMISKGRVQWEKRFTEAPLKLHNLPVKPGGKVKGKLNGETVSAIYFPPPWSSLEWSDGDVWVRVPKS
eukprot:TRINITY_DN7826_c0_g2_i1.p1 TRINITY_DN7826_c0_g2~~TRINITY_DN7826_c0_g2_i1.p1  ORF type:complete len:447 (-),score=90.19 TRINITY_DN7826_c0_g2_i1:526-1866(-)